MKNKEDKFKGLFESTADEIFYDFVKKHKKKIIGLIISVILIIITITVEYSNNEKINNEISYKIHEVINKTKNGENCNKVIDELIKKTKTSKFSDVFRLDRNKISYRATLLLLKDINNFTKEEFAIYLQQVEDLPYVCQYISTMAHAKRFSFTGELLFFKIIEHMYKHKYEEKEILTFFMKKKLHASILNGHMHAYIGLINKNPYILSDLISTYGLMDVASIQNIPEILLTLVDTENNEKKIEISTHMKNSKNIKNIKNTKNVKKGKKIHEK